MVIKLLLCTCIVSLLAVGATNSNVLGPLPQVTSMADGPMAGVPFDIGSLKRNWRSRIEAIRSSGELPIIDIELPRSKLTGYQTNRESLAQLSPPHVSSGGLVLTSPGFPLKACGNDGLR